MNVCLIGMGADYKHVVAFGESPGKFTADAVRFLRGYLPRHKGLAQMIGNHIISSAHSAGQEYILLFGKSKFSVSGVAIKGIPENQFAFPYSPLTDCITSSHEISEA